MENEERVRRIEEMEAQMDETLAAARALEQALEGWEAVQPKLKALAVYYASPDWREDFAADERGELPPELKRGVLSEDGLWDLLEQARELEERLREEE